MWVTMKWTYYALGQWASFGLGAVAAALMLYGVGMFKEDYNKAKDAGVVA